MDMINKNNYEAWLLDYAEGNLSQIEQKQVEAFLEEQPEVKAELEAFEPVYLEPDTSITFDKKEELKKESGNSKVVFFNFNWRIAAAAAAIIIGVIAILPLIFNNNQPSTITVADNVPLWERPALEGVPAEARGDIHAPANEQVASNEEPASTKTKGESVASERKESTPAKKATQRESIAGLFELEKAGATEITFDRPFYYYERSTIVAGISRSPSELNYNFKDTEPRERNDGLINNLLKTEVARAFVPESLSDQLPDKSEGDGGFAPTIYLELPPAGKKLVDKILK